MAHVNKVHSVSTIALVARHLSVEEDLIAELASGMAPEDGLIWVYNLDRPDGVMAFTAYGVENLTTLIADHDI